MLGVLKRSLGTPKPSSPSLFPHSLSPQRKPGIWVTSGPWMEPEPHKPRVPPAIPWKPASSFWDGACGQGWERLESGDRGITKGTCRWTQVVLTPGRPTFVPLVWAA